WICHCVFTRQTAEPHEAAVGGVQIAGTKAAATASARNALGQNDWDIVNLVFVAAAGDTRQQPAGPSDAAGAARMRQAGQTRSGGPRGGAVRRSAGIAAGATATMRASESA